MLDSNFMGRLKAAIKENRDFLKNEGPGLKAASERQKKAAAAAQSNTANNAAGNANSPIALQLKYLKNMAATLQEGQEKKDLLAKIQLLEQWAATTGVGAATPNATPAGNTGVNPFAALFGSQQGQYPINPFAAVFGGFQGGPAQGNPFNPYGYQSSQGGGNPMQAVMAQWLQGLAQQQNPYR